MRDNYRFTGNLGNSLKRYGLMKLGPWLSMGGSDEYIGSPSRDSLQHPFCRRIAGPGTGNFDISVCSKESQTISSERLRNTPLTHHWVSGDIWTWKKKIVTKKPRFRVCFHFLKILPLHLGCSFRQGFVPSSYFLSWAFSSGDHWC